MDLFKQQQSAAEVVQWGNTLPINGTRIEDCRDFVWNGKYPGAPNSNPPSTIPIKIKKVWIKDQPATYEITIQIPSGSNIVINSDTADMVQQLCSFFKSPSF